MSTIINLANQTVHIVTGTRGAKPRAEHVYNIDAPEGTIINGMIMDQGSFAEFIKDIWKHFGLPAKDVYLIVTSNKIASKRFEVPQLSKRKTLEYIDREFQDNQREEEGVYAYTELSRDKRSGNRTIYAEVADKSMIKDYVEFFKGCGIEIKEVIPSTSNLSTFVGKRLAGTYKNFVFQLSDGNVITNILFVDGVFMYNTSQRLFHDKGTLEYIEDAVRSISNIRQFMKANHIEADIENVILAGFNEYDVNTFGSTLSDFGINAGVEMYRPLYGNTAVEKLEGSSAVGAVSGLAANGPESGFLSNMSAKKEQKKEDKILKNGLIISGIVAAVLIVVAAVFAVLSIKAGRDYAVAKSQSDALKPQLLTYVNTKEESSRLSEEYANVVGTGERINTYPVCDDEIVGTIENATKGYADIYIKAFDAETGHVDFIARAGDVEKINVYIAKLAEEDIFTDVSYVGYTYNEAEEKWDINVSCTLAEGVGREVSE